MISPPNCATGTPGRILRLIAACVLWALLTAYLLFNRSAAAAAIPAAHGLPPIYIGELVLFGCLLAVLSRYRGVFLAPCRASWAFRLIAVFFIYGSGRALLDSFGRGVPALRDGVIALYALTAFLAPALWTELSGACMSSGESGSQGAGQRPALQRSARLPLHIFSVLLPISIAAGVFVAAVKTNYLPARHFPLLKPDFLAISAGVSTWMCLSAVLRYFLKAAPSEGVRSAGIVLPAILGLETGAAAGVSLFFPHIGISLGGALLAIVLCAGVALMIAAQYYRPPATSGMAVPRLLPLYLYALGAGAAGMLTVSFPHRTILMAAGPLAVTVALSSCYTRARRWTAVAILIVAIPLVFMHVMRSGKAEAFREMEREGGLTAKLDFSLDEYEAYLAAHPETFPLIAEIPSREMDASSLVDRWRTIWSTSKEHATINGALAAEAEKWRAAFWLRCCHYAAHQAPWLGLGFGNNLTNVMRETPVWPMFILSYVQGNRSPHCAHITIFTRLGWLGLSLWLAILLVLYAGALRRCHDHLNGAADSSSDAAQRQFHRTQFWAGLTLLGLWVFYLWTMSLGVVLENPFGGMWFWALSGALAMWSIRRANESSALG